MQTPSNQMSQVAPIMSIQDLGTSNGADNKPWCLIKPGLEKVSRYPDPGKSSQSFVSFVGMPILCGVLKERSENEVAREFPVYWTDIHKPWSSCFVSLSCLCIISYWLMNAWLRPQIGLGWILRTAVGAKQVDNGRLKSFVISYTFT